MKKICATYSQAFLPHWIANQEVLGSVPGRRQKKMNWWN